jgi:pimeloyl-ACP methyl ester carboxylesterase
VPSFLADGLELHYEERGDGEPVVLLHGFTSCGEGNWQRTGWMDLIAEHGFRAVALDFPGHGFSGRLDEPQRCTTERLAADVVALLDHLWAGPASLFGFSMGGGVALQVAMDSPDRLDRVVIGGVGDAALKGLHDPREIAALVATFEANPADADGPDETAAGVIRRNAELGGNDPRALLPFLRCGGWPGGLDELRPLALPVLVVLAEHDEYMRGAAAILERLPEAATISVARGHHDVLADEAVRRGVVAFLHGSRGSEPL